MIFEIMKIEIRRKIKNTKKNEHKFKRVEHSVKSKECSRTRGLVFRKCSRSQGLTVNKIEHLFLYKQSKKIFNQRIVFSSFRCDYAHPHDDFFSVFSLILRV